MNNLPNCIFDIILAFANHNKIDFRLLSKNYCDQYSNYKLILESYHKYMKRLRHAKEVISLHIHIQKSHIQREIESKWREFPIYQFKNISKNEDKEIDKLSLFLVKNRSLVINNFGESTVFYYKCIDDKLFVESFGENYVDIEKIRLNDKITYNLSIVCVDLGNVIRIDLTDKEALSLIKAFDRVSEY